jgi:hypothetical protein
MKCAAYAAPPLVPTPKLDYALPLERALAAGRSAANLPSWKPVGSTCCCRSETVDNSLCMADGRAPWTSYCVAIGFVAGRAVSFQITILKVLAGHPDGRASVAELTRYVSILMSSGSDWTDRMRRLAARAPNLEIFADTFVLRDEVGWCITDSGRQFLATLEAPIPVHAEENEQPPGPSVTVVTAPSQVQPTLRLVVDNTRTLRPAAQVA